MKTRASISALITAALLAGCGGGGGGASVAPSQPTGSNSPQMVKLSLKVPAKAKQVQRKVLIGGKYVSPATLGVGVNYSTTLTSFTNAQLATPNLALDLSACQPTQFSTCTINADGSESFTVQFPVPPGNYTAELATWDQSPTGGTGTTGTFTGFNLLSTASFALNITAGQAPNSPNFTLNGIPTSVAVSSVPVQSHVNSTPAGFEITGNAAQQFFVNALDADGFIITGLGAPTMSLSDATGSFTFVQNGGNPNQFAVYAQNAALQNTNGVTVTATATSVAGSGIAPLNGTATMIPVPELWYSDSAGNITGGGMTINTSTSTSSCCDVVDRVSGSASASLGTDSGGNVWATQSGNVQEFSASSYSLPMTLSNNFLNDPCGNTDTSSGMAFDASYRMWITSPTCGTGGGVFAYTPVALGTPSFQIGAKQAGTLSGAMSVSIAPNTPGVPAALRGAIFVGAVPASGSVDVLTLSGSTLADTYPSIVTNGSGKTSIVAMGPDGTLWVYDGTNLNAYTVTFSGTITATFVTSIVVGISGSQMAVDPIGHVWAANGNYVSYYYLSNGSIPAVSNVYDSAGTITGVSISP